MHLRFALCILALAAVPAASAQIAPQRPSRDWLPSDRTVIGDFTHITSVAAASDRVFVTSPTSLLIWRPQYQRWEGPFAPPEPGMISRVFTSLVDPLDNSLWMAAPDGWIHYQPDLRSWTSGTVPGGIQQLAFDLAAPMRGLFLRTASGWRLVPRGGFSASPSPPPAQPEGPASVSDVLRSHPTLQANAAQILMDNRMRSVQYTSAAQAFDRRGWFIGTWGRGLLYLAEGAALPQRLQFGLPGDFVGALFGAPGGVWAANDRTTLADAGLTLVATDLSEFTTLQGPAATGFPFTQVRHIAGQGSALWLGTDHGVVRIDPAGGRTRVFDEAAGLPDSRILSLTSRYGQIVAGTPRGVVRIDDSLEIHRVAPKYAGAAYAVAISGDSIWVGTDAGLLVTAGDSASLYRPSGLGTASLQVPVVGLAWLGDTLVALTPDQLLWRTPRGPWKLGPVLSNTLGRLRVFEAQGNGFWVAGDRGVGYAGLDTPPLRSFFAGDIPGDVFDLEVDPDYLWIATSAGLVRFLLDAIRP